MRSWDGAVKQHWAARLCVTVMLAALGAGSVAVPAHAEADASARVSGLWYVDRLKLPEVRDLGLTGKGITIAVIDDAINPEVAELQGADIEVVGQFCRDQASGSELPAATDDVARAHGTDVTAMLVGNGVAADGGQGTQGIVPDATVRFYASDGVAGTDGDWTCDAYNPVTGEFASDSDVRLSEFGGLPTVPSALAAYQAIQDGVDIISISSVTSAWSSIDWMPVAIYALQQGIPIVAGTNNPGATLDEALNTIPAGLNGSVAVGGVDVDGNPILGVDQELGDITEADGLQNMGFAGPGYQMLVPSSSGGWSPGLASGTSLATPLIAGTIALGLEHTPDATANQVIRAMMSSTGKGTVREPEWIDPQYGYGIVNPVAMLGVDPLQFPDENPLFVTSPDDPRCGAGASVSSNGELVQCRWTVGPTIDAVQAQLPPGVRNDNVTESSPAAKLLQSVGSIVLIASIALVLLGAVVIAVVVARQRTRRSKRADGTPTNRDGSL